MKKLILLSLLALSGCAYQHPVRVLSSKSEIKTYHLDVSRQDVLICDADSCRVVQP